MRPPGCRSSRWSALDPARVFVCSPLYVMVTPSLKPLQDVQGEFTWLPGDLTLRPFVDIWWTVPLGRYFVNSLIVSRSRDRRARWRSRSSRRTRSAATGSAAASAFTVTVLSTQMFPGILFLLPLFLIFVNIGDGSPGSTLYGSRARADHHVPDVLAAVLDLDAGRLLRLDPARAGRGGAGRRRGAARRAVPGRPARPRARHRRGRRLRVHDRLGRGAVRLGA